MIGPARRAVLGGGLAVLATPATAAAAAARRRAQVWIDYEARLRSRGADAGGGRFDEAAAGELLVRTNTARRQAKIAQVAWSEVLAETARAHAADLAARDYVEHLSPEGFDPTDRLGLVSRQMIGSPSENIAFHRGGRSADPAALMEIWRSSGPHWTNLLRAKHSHAGFGVARKGDRAYAVGLYARPDGSLAEPLPFLADTRGELIAALRSLPPGFMSFWLDEEGEQGDRGLRAGDPPAVATEPRVYRLRLIRATGVAASESLYGPIFVWRGG